MPFKRIAMQVDDAGQDQIPRQVDLPVGGTGGLHDLRPVDPQIVSGTIAVGKDLRPGQAHQVRACHFTAQSEMF